MTSRTTHEERMKEGHYASALRSACRELRAEVFKSSSSSLLFSGQTQTSNVVDAACKLVSAYVAASEDEDIGAFKANQIVDIMMPFSIDYESERGALEARIGLSWMRAQSMDGRCNTASGKWRSEFYDSIVSAATTVPMFIRRIARGF